MRIICWTTILALATVGKANARLKGSTLSDLDSSASNQFVARALQDAKGPLPSDYGNAESVVAGPKHRKKKTSSPHSSSTTQSPGAATNLSGKDKKNSGSTATPPSPTTKSPGWSGKEKKNTGSTAPPYSGKSSSVSTWKPNNDKVTKTPKGATSPGWGAQPDGLTADKSGGPKQLGKKADKMMIPMAFVDNGPVLATQAVTETATQTPTELQSVNADSYDLVATELDRVERSLSVVAFEYETTSGLIPSDVDYVELSRTTETFLNSFFSSFFQTNLQGVKFGDVQVNQYIVLLPRLVQFNVSAFFTNQSQLIPQAAQLDSIVQLNLMNGTAFYYMYLDLLHQLPFGPFATTFSFQYISDAEKLKEAQGSSGNQTHSFELDMYLIPAALAVGAFFLCVLIYSCVRDRRRGRMIHGIEEMESINSKEGGDSTKADDEHTLTPTNHAYSSDGPNNPTPKASHSSKSLHSLYHQENREYTKYLEEKKDESMHSFEEVSLDGSRSTGNKEYTAENIDPPGSFTTKPPVDALYFSSQPLKDAGALSSVMESVTKDHLQENSTALSNSLASLSSVEAKPPAKVPVVHLTSAFTPATDPLQHNLSTNESQGERTFSKIVAVDTTDTTSGKGESIIKTPYWANKGFLRPVRRDPSNGPVPPSSDKVEGESPDKKVNEENETGKPEFLKIALRSTKATGLPLKEDPPANTDTQEPKRELDCPPELPEPECIVDSPAASEAECNVTDCSKQYAVGHQMSEREVESVHEFENCRQEKTTPVEFSENSVLQVHGTSRVLEPEGTKPLVIEHYQSSGSPDINKEHPTKKEPESSTFEMNQVETMVGGQVSALSKETDVKKPQIVVVDDLLTTTTKTLPGTNNSHLSVPANTDGLELMMKWEAAPEHLVSPSQSRARKEATKDRSAIEDVEAAKPVCAKSSNLQLVDTKGGVGGSSSSDVQPKGSAQVANSQPSWISKRSTVTTATSDVEPETLKASENEEYSAAVMPTTTNPTTWLEKRGSDTTATSADKLVATKESTQTSESVPEWMLKFKMMGLKKQED